MFAAPSPATLPAMAAGAKTFTTDLGDTVTITKAYMVIASTTIETSCDDSFYASLNHMLRESVDGALDMVIPSAHAHTTATPTSTGEPHVIDILAEDDTPVAIGSMSPSVADYCPHFPGSRI